MKKPEIKIFCDTIIKNSLSKLCDSFFQTGSGSIILLNINFFRIYIGSAVEKNKFHDFKDYITVKNEVCKLKNSYPVYLFLKVFNNIFYFSRIILYFSWKKLYFSGNKLYFFGRKLYFSGRKLYFSERKPYFFGRKLYFSERKPYFSGRKPYFSERKPYFSGRKPYFSGRKPYFSGRNFFFSRIILCFSWKKLYFFGRKFYFIRGDIKKMTNS